MRHWLFSHFLLWSYSFNAVAEEKRAFADAVDQDRNAQNVQSDPGFILSAC